MAEKLDDSTVAFGLAMDRLGPGSTLDKLEAVLAEAQSRMPWPRLHATLLERVALHDTARDRLALVLHATEPDVAETALGKSEMAGVFDVLVAGADTAGMDLFLSRAHLLLESLPQCRRDLPEVGRLIEIATQVERQHELTGDALVSLAQRIEDLNEAGE